MKLKELVFLEGILAFSHEFCPPGKRFYGGASDILYIEENHPYDLGIATRDPEEIYFLLQANKPKVKELILSRKIITLNYVYSFCFLNLWTCRENTETTKSIYKSIVQKLIPGGVFVLREKVSLKNKPNRYNSLSLYNNLSREFDLKTIKSILLYFGGIPIVTMIMKKN